MSSITIALKRGDEIRGGLTRYDNYYATAHLTIAEVGVMLSGYDFTPEEQSAMLHRLSAEARALAERLDAERADKLATEMALAEVAKAKALCGKCGGSGIVGGLPMPDDAEQCATCSGVGLVTS